MASTFAELGTSYFFLRLQDDAGQLAQDPLTVTVIDTTPPQLDAIDGPLCLWPPTHKYVVLDVAALADSVSDVCDPDPSLSILSASSDQPDFGQGLGDGATASDVVVFPDHVCLRAERNRITGRTYTLQLQSQDSSGNLSQADVQVRVPRSRNEVGCHYLTAPEVADDNDPRCEKP